MASSRRLTVTLQAGTLVAALLGAPAVAALPAAGPLTEYEVKAGFLYNFAKLVEWPAATPATLSLCIFGADPFGAAKESMDGKTVGRKTLAVRSAVPEAELRNCQIVFVPHSGDGRLDAVLHGVRDRPVLTVGDGEGSAARGLVIGFYRDGEKVRFEINVDAARRAGLPISSRLLKLARIVHDQDARRE